MITKATGYQSSDGKFHRTIDDAQSYEMGTILLPLLVEHHYEQAHDELDRETRLRELTQDILDKKDQFIDILTMKPNSLPKARKINGGTKKRTPKHIAAQNTLPLDTTEPPRAA